MNRAARRFADLPEREHDSVIEDVAVDTRQQCGHGPAKFFRATKYGNRADSSTRRHPSALATGGRGSNSLTSVASLFLKRCEG